MAAATPEATDQGAPIPVRRWLDALPEAILLCDALGRLLAVNLEAERVLGRRALDLMGQPLDSLIPREATGIVEPALRRFVRSSARGPGAKSIVTRALRGDGTSIYLELRVGEMEVVEGRPIYAIALHDVSDRLAAEDRLSAMNEKLSQVASQGAMRTLAADLMHELNQPLASLVNYIEASRLLLTRQPGSDAGVIEMLEAAQRQATRAGEITRQLRRFVVREQVDLKAEPVVETVQDAVRLVLTGRHNPDIRCTFAFDPAAPTVMVDRGQIQQVLVNLLRHAVEVLEPVSPADRQILIKTIRQENAVVFMISDNGPGLSEQVQRSLYETFVAAQTGTEKELELLMSRRIVEAHGGRLIAENRPEGGARFCFHLPAVRETAS